MPKKGKKGAKGKKGKKGAKGKKGKKGKKGAKGAKKEGERADIVKLAEKNTHVWEVRLDQAEKDTQNYRETAARYAQQTEEYQNEMRQMERDTIDVIRYLKKKEEEKDGHISKLEEDMRLVREEYQKEKGVLLQEIDGKVCSLQAEIDGKNAEINLLKGELRQVKDFRKKRGQLQKELDDIRSQLQASERVQKDALTQVEQKHLEEKMRLQKEATRKIEHLASRAHEEAVRSLDETTKSIYKENVRLSRALQLHMDESDSLKQRLSQLEQQNGHLVEKNAVNETVMRNAIAENEHLKRLLTEMEDKVAILEKSLSLFVREFESERTSVVQKAATEVEAGKVELARLQRLLQLRNTEMNRVKKLAKTVLSQRSDMDKFFVDALGYVRAQIAENRTQYRKDAQKAYHHRMLAAHQGKDEFPRIRTFSQAPFSTNSVFGDLVEAEKWDEVPAHVDISELTWEQKERVLRELFARMNRNSQQPNAAASLPPLSHSRSMAEEDGDDLTFLTQAKMSRSSLSLRSAEAPS